MKCHSVFSQCFSTENSFKRQLNRDQPFNCIFILVHPRHHDHMQHESKSTTNNHSDECQQCNVEMANAMTQRNDSGHQQWEKAGAGFAENYRFFFCLRLFRRLTIISYSLSMPS